MVQKVILLCLILLLAVPAAAQDATGDLLGRINRLRSSLGLPGYTLNGALSAAAQSQAAWMAESGLISHTRPDGSGPRTRAINAGYGTTDVSENIYGGTNASVDTAWTFWVNSAIHYAGLTNDRYQEVGVGVARSNGLTTYVLVFGNPGGPPPFVPQAAARAGDGGGNNAASAGPPSYVVGVNEQGFIMHQIQPGDTLGDIALLYGYTWGDLPYMREVNDIQDHFNLVVGEVFLVPPHDGTFTPTPDNATPAPEEPTGTPPSMLPTMTPTPTATPTRMAVATSAVMPELLALPLETTPTTDATIVALVPTPAEIIASSVQRSQGPSTWLILGLMLQAGLVVVAGVEFVRRSWRKGKR